MFYIQNFMLKFGMSLFSHFFSHSFFYISQIQRHRTRFDEKKKIIVFTRVY